MSERFFTLSTGKSINIFETGGLKVTQAVPEKHIINFFASILYASFIYKFKTLQRNKIKNNSHIYCSTDTIVKNLALNVNLSYNKYMDLWSLGSERLKNSC